MARGSGDRRRDGRSGHARLVPRRDGPPRPVQRPGQHLADPRQAPPRRPFDPREARLGRRAALATVATGIAWALLTAAGDAWGWPTRTRALFDLMALAGFGVALYLTWQAWRLRRNRG